MADKEDSIHVKIKIDVDEEDRALQENLASNLAKADEQQFSTKTQGKISKDSEIEEEIEEIKDKNKKIRKEMKGLVSPQAKKKKAEAEQDKLLFERWKKSGIGKLANLSESQLGNLLQLGRSPESFIGGSLLGGLGKAGKGKAGSIIKLVSIALTAILASAAGKALLESQFEPGRLLDRRFERIAQKESLNFYSRELQEELRHGYQEIRVTSRQGLRGGASQVNGNLFQFSSGTTGGIQSTPYLSSQVVVINEAAGGQPANAFGNPKSNFVYAPGPFG